MKLNFLFGYTCVSKQFFVVIHLWQVKNPSKVKAFGMHLRRLREAEGLSQQNLADAADLAKITIQRIENAKYSATIDVLVSIAGALKISLSELVEF